MANSTCTSDDMIIIGEILFKLCDSNYRTQFLLHQAVLTLKDRLIRCGYSSCMPLVDGLVELTATTTERIRGLDAKELEEVQHTSTDLRSILLHEAKATTAILSHLQLPQPLTELQNNLGYPLPDYQEAMRKDVELCLKAGLTRPAIVMGWALGFDIVRAWVFNDTTGKLADFNTQLQSKPLRKGPTQITTFEDFFHVGEYDFLEVCKNAQGAGLVVFTEKQFRNLQSLLDQRNEFAHANYSHASQNVAVAYVERVLKAVTETPFK